MNVSVMRLPELLCPSLMLHVSETPFSAVDCREEFESLGGHNFILLNFYQPLPSQTYKKNFQQQPRCYGGS